MKLWKKVLSAATAGVLCLGSVGVTGMQSVLESVGTVLSASAYVPDSYDGTYGDLYYKEYGSSIAIVGCNEDVTSIEIPEEINGKPVTRIGNSAFQGCTSLTAITIPDSVTRIEDYTFEECTSLEKITIPNSVTDIGIYAFSSCTNLTEITLPNSIAGINYGTFRNCISLKEITIPDGVKGIYSKDFVGMDVCYVGAFEDCTNLTKITIPNSVTSIEKDTFLGCTNLKNVYISDLESWYKIDFNDYDSSPYCYNSSPLCNGANLYVNGELLTEITIPDSMTRIGLVVSGCTSLAKITIPDSVTDIGTKAFKGCTSLKEVIIPHSVKSIADDAFEDCDADIKYITEDTYLQDSDENVIANITHLTVKHKEGKIPAGAYQGGKRMKEVTLEEGITLIEDDAFANCDNLEKIVIPKSVTGIRYTAFTYDTKLTMYGYKDTYAEKYAEMFGFPFVALDDSDTPPVTTTTTTETTTTTTTTTIAATETTPPDTEPPATETTASTAQTLPAESTTTTTNTTAATETTTVTTAATTTTKPTPTLAKGDLDGSDNIDSTDIYYALYYVANIAVGNSGGLTREQIAAADVDGSGFVDSTDIYYMLYYVALHGAGIHQTWEEVLAK